MKPSVRASSVEGLRSEIKDLRRQVQDLHRIIGDVGGTEPIGVTEPEASGSSLPFYVAASDATDEEKALSNYVCSGTGDHATINAAISDASVSATPVVLLSSGTFDIGGALNWVHTLRGFAGSGGSYGEAPTKLDVSSAIAGAVMSCEAASHFEMVLGAAVGAGIEVYSLGVNHVQVRAFTGGSFTTGIDAYDECRLHNVKIRGASTASGVGISMNGASPSSISNVAVDVAATGLAVTISTATIAISSSIFRSCGTASLDTGGATMAIAGNVFDASNIGIDNTSGGAINTDAAGANTFTGGGTAIAT